MPGFTSLGARMLGPLPRRDIVAICAFLNRAAPRPRPVDGCPEAADWFLDRLAAAARMQ